MTAGSGRKLCESFPKSGPLGRCLKTLLASETWASPEFYLTWKAQGTKQGSLVYRLVPSAPRIGENGTGSSDTVATWQPPQKALVPEIPEYWQATRGAKASKGPNLCTQVMMATWPTPDASDAGKTSRSGERQDEMLMGGLVRASWATPTKADGMGGPGNSGRDGGENLRTQALLPGPMPSTCLALTESFVVRLTTLSAWLMGYTGAYLAHWETASSRRSRRKS
jgi:hypothetical protein